MTIQHDARGRRLTIQVKYTRRQGSWRDHLEALLHQGVQLFCWRTKRPITFENLHLVQREHEPALCLFKTWAQKRAADIPANWRFSLSDAHAVVTNGTKATTKGSTKGIAAAVKRIDSGKMAVPLGLKPDIVAAALLTDAEDEMLEIKFGKVPKGSKLLGVTMYQSNPDKPKRAAPKMRGPGFDKTRTRKMSGKVVARKPKKERT